MRDAIVCVCVCEREREREGAGVEVEVEECGTEIERKARTSKICPLLNSNSKSRYILLFEFTTLPVTFMGK